MKNLEAHINSYFGVTNKNAQKIASLFTESNLKKGDYFVKQEQYCDKLSFIQDGFIRVFATSNNKETTQWISSKNYFITDIYSLIFKQRARWNIQALTDCKLYTIEKENYYNLNELVPNWSDIEKKLIASCFITLEDRVFGHLSLTAEERYHKFYNNNKDLFKAVPLQYIASMLGMSPETLSRIRRKNVS